MKTLKESLVNANNIKSVAKSVFEEDDIITASVISILKTHSYLETSSFQKKLKNIDYEDILYTLKNLFDREYTQNDIKRKGKVMSVIQKNKKVIEYLINGYKYKHFDGKKIKERYKDY